MSGSSSCPQQSASSQYPPHPSFSSPLMSESLLLIRRVVRRLGSREGREGREWGREGVVGEWRESCLKCRPKRWWAFPWKQCSQQSVTSSVRGEATGWGRRGWGGGNATEMHPDWLGLKHGSLRPLWSSATSWGEDKDGDVWNLPRLQNSLHRHEKPTHHTFTFCSVGPCGPTVSPGTPWGHLEATGSGTQRSPPSPCRPWPGPATGAEETCWRKSKTPSSNPPNVPALLGQTLILVWPPLAGMGSEPLRFHPERTRCREMMRWWDSVTVKYKLMIVFYRVNIQAHFKGIVCHFGKCSS